MTTTKTTRADCRGCQYEEFDAGSDSRRDESSSPEHTCDVALAWEHAHAESPSVCRVVGAGAACLGPGWYWSADPADEHETVFGPFRSFEFAKRDALALHAEVEKI